MPTAVTMETKMSISILVLAAVVLAARSSAITDACPEGWSQMGDKCYSFYDESVDQMTASGRCGQLGGSLAMPKSQVINEMLAGLSGGALSWIGVDDRIDEGVYLFADGSPTSYTNWAPGEPNSYGGANEDCTDFNLHKYGTWNDRPCSMKMKYLCETNAAVANTACPTGYQLTGGLCYKFYSGKTTYNDARDTCLNDGSHLAEPQDQEQNEAIQSLISDHTSWLGATNLKNSQWRWETDGQQVSWEDWLPGRNPSQHCLKFEGNNQGWDDEHCHDKHGFVCQRNPLVPKNTEESTEKPLTVLKSVSKKSSHVAMGAQNNGSDVFSCPPCPTCEPVCGSDGIQYRSLCELELANFKDKDQEITFVGSPPCEDKLNPLPDVPSLETLEAALDSARISRRRVHLLIRQYKEVDEIPHSEECCDREDKYDCVARQGRYPRVFYHNVGDNQYICWYYQAGPVVPKTVIGCSCRKCLKEEEDQTMCFKQGFCAIEYEHVIRKPWCFCLNCTPFEKPGIMELHIKYGARCSCQGPYSTFSNPFQINSS